MHSSYWLIYAQVLTVDEANGKEPCDREQLTQITKYSLGALFDHLKGRTLTVVVTNIRLLHHDVDATGAAQPMLTPDEYEGMAAALRDVLGSVASDHRLPTAWTNKVPHPYEQYEQRRAALGKDDFRATVHDQSEPPITTYAELLRVMAENGVKSTSLDQELVWQTESGVLYQDNKFDRNALFAPQGSTLVDIALPTDLQLDPQTFEEDARQYRRNPYPTHHWLDMITSAKGARPGSAVLSSEAGLIEFKIDTNVFHERTALEEGALFVHLRPGADPTRDARFSLCVQVKIPGMD